MAFLQTLLPLTFVHLVTVLVFFLALKWVVGFPTLLPPPLRALTMTGVSGTRLGTGATIAAAALGLPTAKPGSAARGVAPAFTVVVVAPGLVVVVVRPATVVVGVAADDDPPGGTVPFAEAWAKGAANVAKVLDVVVLDVDVVDVDEVEPPAKLVVEVLDVVLVEVGATVVVVVLVEVVGAVVLDVVVVA